MMNQFFSNMDQYPEMKLLITVGVILVVLIVAWLLLRNLRLWYWKTDKMLDSMQDMKLRMNQIESDLDLIKVNTALLKHPEAQTPGALEEQKGLHSPEGLDTLEESKGQSGGAESDSEIQAVKNEDETLTVSKGSVSAVFEGTAASVAILEEDQEDSLERSDSSSEGQGSMKPQSQREKRIGAARSREERIAEKRALDARHTMEISRAELSALVAEWEEQQRNRRSAEQENVSERREAPGNQNQNARKPRKLKKKGKMAEGMEPEGLKKAEIQNQNQTLTEKAGDGEAAMNEKMKDVKKSLEELQKQKEQLEADLKAKIRM